MRRTDWRVTQGVAAEVNCSMAFFCFSKLPMGRVLTWLLTWGTVTVRLIFAGRVGPEMEGNSLDFCAKSFRIFGTSVERPGAGRGIGLGRSKHLRFTALEVRGRGEKISIEGN